MLSSLQAKDLSLILKQIPKNELEDIRDLFNNLIYQNHFSYTLFGEKAVSISYCTISKPFEILRKHEMNNQILSNVLGAKWEKWKVIQPKFPIKNYLFLEEAIWSDHYLRYIILINRKKFINVFNKNSEIFQRELGYKTTAENLLTKIEQLGDLRKVLNHNELLLGILLDYGKNNADFYNRRNQIKILRDHYGHILVKDSSFVKELNEQIAEITDILQPCSEQDCELLFIPSIHFVGDAQSPETLALRQKYQAQREEITDIYAKGDLLEITLSKLIQN